MIRSAEHAHLSAHREPRDARAAVLVLHGGSSTSEHRGRWFDPAVLRLWPVAWSVGRHLPHVAVYRLRFAVRGWNGNGVAALRDGRWALARLRAAHPGAPIVLVGHSMGGRVAARLAGEAQVAGAVLLAPWLPPGDPVSQVRGQQLVVVQGGTDLVCPELETREWLSRAERSGATIDKTVLRRLGHTMLGRPWLWHRLAWQGVGRILSTRPGQVRADTAAR